MGIWIMRELRKITTLYNHLKLWAKHVSGSCPYEGMLKGLIAVQLRDVIVFLRPLSAPHYENAVQTYERLSFQNTLVLEHPYRVVIYYESAMRASPSLGTRSRQYYIEYW